MLSAFAAQLANDRGNNFLYRMRIFLPIY